MKCKLELNLRVEMIVLHGGTLALAIGPIILAMALLWHTSFVKKVMTLLVDRNMF